MPPLSLQSLYDEYAADTREDTEKERQAEEMRSRLASAQGDCFKTFMLNRQRTVTDAVRAQAKDGFTRMADCRQALNVLDTLGWSRSYHQRVFHDNFIRASARVFFKMDPPGAFARAHQKILDLNGWDTLSQEILISTPRRFGKTISVSMFAAAMLVSCTNVELSIYSTCKRISQKLLQNVQRFVLLVYQGLGREPMRVIRSNMEELVVQGPDSMTDIRTINSYPSKVGCALRAPCECVFCVHKAGKYADPLIPALRGVYPCPFLPHIPQGTRHPFDVLPPVGLCIHPSA